MISPRERLSRMGLLSLYVCFLLLTIALPWQFNSAYAQISNTVTFEPASLKSSNLSLQKLIKFPKSKLKSKADFAVYIRCDAFVKKNGRLSSNMCYQTNEELFLYVEEINRAARKTVLNPARVNGLKKSVYFQYYVLFMKKQGTTTVDVIANSGLQVEQYGVDYSSAQRYQESRGNFAVGCNPRDDITVKAIISELGKVSNVEVEGVNPSPKCVELLEKSFYQQTFIPAMFQGQAIPSFYAEKIFGDMRYF